MTLPRRLERITILLLLAAGFGLRVFRLDIQSIWHDEGASIDIARYDPVAIIGLSVADIHPPLYYGLLHYWMLLVGDKEFPVRFLSVIFGVLTAVALFQLGRLLLGRRGAVLSLLVAAVAPFLVYYSQESRPYSLGLFLTVLFTLAALKWLRGERTRTWLACYVAAAAAAAYTHYYTWLAIGCLNFFVLLWAWRSSHQDHRRLVGLQSGKKGPSPEIAPSAGRSLSEASPGRVLAGWMMAQVALGLIYLPWAGVLLNKYQEYLTPGSSVSPLTFIYQTIVSFGLGYSAGQTESASGLVGVPGDQERVLVMALTLAVIAGLGLVAGVIKRRRQRLALQWAFLPVSLLLSVAAIVVLSWDKRDVAPRYLMFAAPAYYLLLSQGTNYLLGSGQRVKRGLGALAVLAVLATSFLSLNNYYYNQAYWRDDVRGLASFLSEHSRSDDAIVMNAFYIRPGLDYYYRGGANEVGLPGSTPANWDEELPTLEDLARRHDRIWLVLWQDYFTDPQKQVQGWLDKHAIRTDFKSFHGYMNVLGYLTRPPIVDSLPPGSAPGLMLGDAVELAGYQLPAGPVCAGKDAHFTIYWRALQGLSTDYTVFVHLVDGQGKTVAQADSQPAGGGYPTTRWQAGTLVADERWIGVPPKAAPGQYYLEIGMYDRSTMKVLGSGGPGPSQLKSPPFQVTAGCSSGA